MNSRLALAINRYVMYILYVSRRSRVSVAALRSKLAGVLRTVEQGNEVLVTRRGHAVAMVVPATDPEERLRAAGVHPAHRPGAVPRVRPVRLPPGVSLTRTVIADRD